MTEPVLQPLTEADFTPLAALASTIWHAHYSSIVSTAQIDYMLAGRYTPENLRTYINAEDRWLELLKLDTRPIGYCSCSLLPDGTTMKLQQLYLLSEFRGRGYGSLMLRHIEARTRALGRSVIMLTVNKQNHTAIAIYQKSGFRIKQEAVFDIGNGFVMDDYVMEKVLA